MTQANNAHAVDSDRVDDNRHRWRPVLAALAVGAVIGGVLGASYAGSRPQSNVATTAISVLPDSFVLGNATSNATTLDASAFVQSQLVVLNGRQLADTVGTQLKLGGRPSINSTEIGQTYVVQLTATASTQAQAVAIATAASQQYIDLRTKALTTQINTSLTGTNAQIATVSKALATANASATGGVTPAQTALQTEYVRLLGVASSLKLALTQASSVVTVFSPVSVADQPVSTTAKYTVGGGALGAILALALLILRQRTSRRVRNLGDVADLGVPVVLPVISRQSARARKRASGWRFQDARLLAARLTNGAERTPTPIVVIGATPGVGTSFLASALATSVSARGPVLLLLAAEVIEGRGSRDLAIDRSEPAIAALDPAPTAGAGLATTELADSILETVDPNVFLLPCDFVGNDAAGFASGQQSRLLADTVARAADAGWLVVVDAPALSESDIGLDCAEHGTAVLVVGRNRTAPADIIGSFELFAARGQRMEGAVLNDVPRRWWPVRRSANSSAFTATWTDGRVATGSAGTVIDGSPARPFIRPPRPTGPATPGRAARRASEHRGVRPVRRLAGTVTRRKP